MLVSLRHAAIGPLQLHTGSPPTESLSLLLLIVHRCVVLVDIFYVEIVDAERERDFSCLVSEKSFGVFSFDVAVFCQMTDEVVMRYESAMLYAVPGFVDLCIEKPPTVYLSRL